MNVVKPFRIKKNVNRGIYRNLYVHRVRITIIFIGYNDGISCTRIVAVTLLLPTAFSGLRSGY